MIIRAINETEQLVTIGRVVPEREAWLLDNWTAKELVATGLRQAGERRFSDSPPDIGADSALADKLEEL